MLSQIRKVSAEFAQFSRVENVSVGVKFWKGCLGMRMLRLRILLLMKMFIT